MNIRDLKYLIAVYDLKSFSKAAERCFVSQPTLSGQLKKLEEELGSVLIERSTRKVLFTPLGEEVVRSAREAILSIDNIKSLVKSHDDPLAGECHIGLIPTVGPFLLPLVMPALSAEFPQLELYLHELQTEVLIKKLLNGELDAIILAKLDWSHPVTEMPLYTEKMQLAVSQTSELAGSKSPLKRSVLDGRSVLMLEDGHCLRDQAMGVCFAAGASEDTRYQATSMDTLLHMVATGAGITLIPELATNKAIEQVEYLSFADPQPSRDIVLLMRNNSPREQLLIRVSTVIGDSVKQKL